MPSALGLAALARDSYFHYDIRSIFLQFEESPGARASALYSSEGFMGNFYSDAPVRDFSQHHSLGSALNLLAGTAFEGWLS